MSDINVTQAGVAEAGTVGGLVYRLLSELNPDGYAARKVTEFSDTAHRLLEANEIFALLATTTEGDAVGVLTLNECASVYAGGRFGEICELYVTPKYRSHRVGAKLIDAAKVIAHQRGWAHLEVGAPDVPRWQRSVDFYTAYGFYVVGPRLHLDL